MGRSIEELRKAIDEVDRRIVKAVADRMDIAAEIAEYKKEHGLATLDSRREREKLAEISGWAREDLRPYYHVLYSLLFELSRAHQNKIIGNNADKFEEIRTAIEQTPKMFPKTASVAVQGVEGAYSNIACEKLFSMPNIQYFNSFDGVFNAVDKGFCKYGILPIENSTAGSVKQVYDLMLKYHFYIVRSTRIKINHCLVAKPGAEIKDIKEIVSHEQALNQCADFIQTLGKDIRITPVENTAIAAQMVANSDRNDIAAISSYRCAELYGLKSLETNIADCGNNHTRFICISKKPEIYPGADKTSLMVVLSHRPGALYKMLARFYALGINLQKLESRPIPERDFEFMFYFDLDTSIYSEEFVQIICDVNDCCEEFQYLGSYNEVI